MSTRSVSQPPASVRQIQRNAWRRLFGSMIEECRRLAGRSVEETARLAGMESSEWAAIEAGHIPADPGRLRPMADALSIRYEQMVMMVHLCQGAWAE